MTKLIGTPFTDAEKKIALIKQLKDELVGVKNKYFGIEKELVDLMSLKLTDILKKKKELKKLAAEMRKLQSKLKKLGVEIDLEQR